MHLQGKKISRSRKQGFEPVEFQRNTHRYTPEDRALRNYRCEDHRYKSTEVSERHRVHLQGTKISRSRKQGSESVEFQLNTPRCIPEDRALRDYRCEDRRSDKLGSARTLKRLWRFLFIAEQKKKTG